MAVDNSGIHVNRELRELQLHGTYEFPCAGYDDIYGIGEDTILAWHWHEEFEVIYIRSGSILMKIPSKEIMLKKGDCFVINANVLHYGVTEGICNLQSLVFHPRLIAGGEGSAFSKKYILPLIRDPSFSGFLIPKENIDQVKTCFRKAFDALEMEEPGYEFFVRENLSRLFLYLYKEFQPQVMPRETRENDNSRIRTMLDFIHKNYADHITLAEISRSADIGERECLRCFQKTIQLSPIQYLLKYRVMRGADLLLENPEESISNIAGQCGFDSSSNFSKMFRRFYHFTPREYRNKNKETGQSGM